MSDIKTTGSLVLDNVFNGGYKKGKISIISGGTNLIVDQEDIAYTREDRNHRLLETRYIASMYHGFTVSSMSDISSLIREGAFEFWKLMDNIPIEECAELLQDEDEMKSLVARLKLAGYNKEDNP